jgi:hypothetical protein
MSAQLPVPVPHSGRQLSRTDTPSFGHLLADAELLISYAATTGITLDAKDVETLIGAIDRREHAPGDSPPVDHEFSQVVMSLTNIVARTKPVTALSLRKTSSDAKHIIRRYVIWVSVVATVIVSMSLITFITAGASDAIKSEIDSANSKVITLRQRIESKPEVTDDMWMELAQLAISARAIDARAATLKMLLFLGSTVQAPVDEPDWAKVEINPKKDFAEAYSDIVHEYQKVRSYAQGLRESVSFVYGGVAASILPVFYAGLGALAYMLRRLQQSIRNQTFTNVGVNSAHMLVAAIAGTVISLFNGLFTASTVSIPPLGIAFLVGYASDRFFRVLDNLLPARGRLGQETADVPTEPPETTR